MNEYEVFAEDVNSCGGEQYAKKERIEVAADSPESYVKENGRFPIIDISKKPMAIPLSQQEMARAIS